MKLIFILLMTVSCYGQLITVIPGGRGPGGADNTPPAITILTDAIDPVVGAAGSTFVTATISGSKTLVDFAVGDITTTNCTLQNFTTISGSSYTVQVKPTSNGTFSISVAANKCTDTRGINNIASTSSNFPLTFSDGSGFTYDLQNAAEISKSNHARGHTATFSDCTDLGVNLHLAGGEMLNCKYNIGTTINANGNNATNQAIYQFGKCDFGLYTYSDNYNSVDGLITLVRSGNPGTSSSYGSGITTYSASMKSIVLYGRNSNYENVNQTLPITYATGLTHDQMISRGVTFRWDYYAKTTTTSYYRGHIAQGQAKLLDYATQVINANGWYTNFTHWHWWVEDYPKKYFDTLKLITAASDIYWAPLNKAAEYYWVREAIDNVSGTGSTVTINYSKKYPSANYNRILEPAWIKVNLTGTGYAGQSITTSHGGRIRSMGSNVYYISVPLDFTQTSRTFDIFVTPTPNYINLTKPVVMRSGNSITSDQPVKISLYSKLKTEPYEINVAVLERNLTFGTSFTLSSTLNTVTTDYYLAFINAEGISGVLQF
jgi:hypothetical protein